jgi:hypothetical protein
MNITQESNQSADLKGPMTESEFLTAMLEIEKKGVKFAERHRSNRKANPLSYTNEGYVVIQYNDITGLPLLYDSIKSPAAYLSATNTNGRVVGRHQGENYWIYKY